MKNNLYLEVTNDTLVATDRGVMRLADLLHRAVYPSLWAITWSFDGHAHGTSFHRTHKEAKEYALSQRGSTPTGPTKLVKVSQWLADKVNEECLCWTNLLNVDDAVNYEGPEWNH